MYLLNWAFYSYRWMGMLTWLRLGGENQASYNKQILPAMSSTCSDLLGFITSGPVVAMEILGDDAITKWKDLLGPANSAVARTDAPGSIRACFGSDGIRNVGHGPVSFASAARVSFSYCVFHRLHFSAFLNFS